jgi:NAD(P)-dependent dehydrogenase (short-subunit alcohol dehydrogenase family)
MNERGTSLADRVAIVTGGTGGIGAATCKALARHGAHVVVVARTQAKVDGLVAELRGNASGTGGLGLALDVRSESDMETMARRTLDVFGRIDILITCAGLGRPSAPSAGRLPLPVFQLPPAAWDDVIDTNLKGVFLGNRAVIPSMIQQRSGHILNVSSARAALAGLPYASAYCASKFGVTGLSEALFEEVQSFGIKVQVFLPDAVDTPLIQGTAVEPVDAMSPDAVADFIVTMLTLPADILLVRPLLVPVRTRRRRRGREAPSAVSVESGPR